MRDAAHSAARVDLSVALGPLRLDHPLINGSGTLDLIELAAATHEDVLSRPPVAAYVPKTLTLQPRAGNPAPRTLEVAAGLLNSIGLANEGLPAFLSERLSSLLSLPCPIIVSLGGFSLGEYRSGADMLRMELEKQAGKAGESTGWLSQAGLELNISCPNVESGCASIGSDERETMAVVRAVREVWPGFLTVKLSPNVTALRPIAMAAERAGASALTLVNTFKGLALDRRTLRPYLGGVTGGLSGPAIKSLALRHVYEVYQSVGVPLIGMGGVSRVADVLEFMACGASVVGVGAAGLRDPWLPRRLADELALELAHRRLQIGDLVGLAHR